MTVIVAVKDGGKVYVGGDSAGVAGWDLDIRADSKVFINGPYVMGFTSSFRMGQLLRYAFVPPDHHIDVPVEPFMVTTFVDEVRRCLRDGGFAKKNAEQEEGGSFIVGYRGRIFTIGSDYQVAESVDDFAAVGSGDSQALGAMYATKGKPPRERLSIALAASERFCAGVRGPFHIEREP